MEEDINIKKDLKNAQLLSKKNVESYFFGEKTVGGKKTGEKCLIVGVEAKEIEGDLSEQDIIPKEINGIKTDVIQVPKMFAFEYCGDGGNEKSPSNFNPNGACEGHAYDKNQPFSCIPGGISIGTQDRSSAGTLGYTFLNESNQLVGLTNNHVIGTDVYDPSLEDSIEYTVGVLGGKFSFISADGNFYTGAPLFNDQVLPRIEAGRKYVFKSTSALSNHPFILTSSSSGGSNNSNLAITEVKITRDSDGLVLYENGSEQNSSGRVNPELKDNETLEFIYTSGSYSDLYYQCNAHENMGNKIEVIFFGVPFCCSSNKTSSDIEYTDGIINNINKNRVGINIESPSSLDDYLGKRQVIGVVEKSHKLKFNHPSNSYLSEQPVNKIDASTINYGNDVLATYKIKNITSTPTSSSNALPGQKVFKSGRTTGTTPQDINNSTCEIISTSWTGNVYYCSGSSPSIQHRATFEDIIIYFQTGSWFSDAGDSGSVVLTRTSDQDQIIGLHFAGFTFNDDPSSHDFHSGINSYGLACKIGNVKTSLSISDWNGKRSISSTSLSIGESLSLCGDCYDVVESSGKIAEVLTTGEKSKFSSSSECNNIFSKPNSILTQDATAGSNEIYIYIGDIDIFKISNNITINPGKSNEETVLIGSINSSTGRIQLSSNLLNNHTTSSFVVKN